MSLSGIFARLVAVVGAVGDLFRHRGDGSQPPAFGSAPAIPAARRQGIPTLKMPTARGWAAGTDTDCRGGIAGSTPSPPASSIRAGSTSCRTATC